MRDSGTGVSERDVEHTTVDKNGAKNLKLRCTRMPRQEIRLSFTIEKTGSKGNNADKFRNAIRYANKYYNT